MGPTYRTRSVILSGCVTAKRTAHQLRRLLSLRKNLRFLLTSVAARSMRLLGRSTQLSAVPLARLCHLTTTEPLYSPPTATRASTSSLPCTLLDSTRRPAI